MNNVHILFILYMVCCCCCSHRLYRVFTHLHIDAENRWKLKQMSFYNGKMPVDHFTMLIMYVLYYICISKARVWYLDTCCNSTAACLMILCQPILALLWSMFAYMVLFLVTFPSNGDGRSFIDDSTNSLFFDNQNQRPLWRETKTKNREISECNTKCRYIRTALFCNMKLSKQWRIFVLQGKEIKSKYM